MKFQSQNEFVALDLVTKTALAGETVAILFGKEKDRRFWHREMMNEFSFMVRNRTDLSIKQARENWIELSNGGTVMMGPLRITGASMLHAPVLVIVDMLSGDASACQEARCILRPFKDGSRPIYIEV